MNRFRFAFAVVLVAGASLIVPPAVQALDPQHQEAPSDCLGPADPFCAASGGSTGGGSGVTCTATSICRSVNGQETGSVSCTGTTCSRGTGWVKCNGSTTYCGTT